MSTRISIRIFAFISIFLLCIGVTIKELQNDTFYIIKLGEDIFHNGIDLVDNYSWVANLSYTYPHWLYDLFIYIIYCNFGFCGVYVSTIILFVILIFSIYIINLKINKNEFMAFFISIVSIACLYGFAAARAQLVTAILFLWEVYFIELLLKNGKIRYIIYLVIISWLVANLHATSWLFYFIIFLPFLVEHLISLILKNKSFEINKVIVNNYFYIKKLIFSFLLSFCSGIFTPSRICYSYIFKVMQGNSQSYITEHAPMIIIQHPCFVTLILVLLLILIFSKTKIKLNELFMICGLIFMSLVSIRHVTFFYIIGVLYLSIIANRYFRDKGDKTLEILGNLIVKNKIVCFSLIVLFSVASFFKFQENFKQDFVNKKLYPVDASVFIKDNLDVENLKLFNGYNFGSYLLFNDIPVFIDSRCDLYLSEFNGLDYSIFDDAMEVINNYEEKFKFYGVTHALVYKDSVLNKLLTKDKNFSSLYSDEYFELFEVVGYE